jgi:chorismate dehydratase
MTNSPSKSRSAVRLGAISFVNTVPIYSAYRPDESVEVLYDVPAQLNARILAGELDISPVSSACYLRNQDRLVLLEDLSVSSPGAVESVLFLSKEPLGPNVLDMPRISVPNDSETSVALLAHLLQEATGQDLRPWFQIYEAANYQQTLEETGNALIIGDNALMMKESLAESVQDWHCYDLSTLWREKTKLPFVFAVWVANRTWAEAHPERLQQVNHELCRARNQFFAEPALFAAGLQAAQSRSQLPSATLERYYLQCLNYHLTPAHQQSLARFEAILADMDSTERQSEITMAHNAEPLACEQPAAR